MSYNKTLSERPLGCRCIICVCEDSLCQARVSAAMLLIANEDVKP